MVQEIKKLFTVLVKGGLQHRREGIRPFLLRLPCGHAEPADEAVHRALVVFVKEQFAQRHSFVAQAAFAGKRRIKFVNKNTSVAECADGLVFGLVLRNEIRLRHVAVFKQDTRRLLIPQPRSAVFHHVFVRGFKAMPVGIAGGQEAVADGGKAR